MQYLIWMCNLVFMVFIVFECFCFYCYPILFSVKATGAHSFLKTEETLLSCHVQHFIYCV